MSAELEAFAAWFDERVGRAEVALKKARRQLASAEEQIQRPIEKAWEEIESEAGRLVQKSAKPLSQEQAVTKLLGTPKGKALYANYTAARDLVAFTRANTEATWRKRDIAAWHADRSADRVLKAAANGADMDELIDVELAENPALGEALALLKPEKAEASVARHRGEAPRGARPPLTTEGSSVDPAQEEARVWREITTKAGAGDPGSRGFSVRIGSFLRTPLGQRLYGRYERAFAHRVLAEDRNRGPRNPTSQPLPKA